MRVVCFSSRSIACPMSGNYSCDRMPSSAGTLVDADVSSQSILLFEYTMSLDVYKCRGVSIKVYRLIFKLYALLRT